MNANTTGSLLVWFLTLDWQQQAGVPGEIVTDMVGAQPQWTRVRDLGTPPPPTPKNPCQGIIAFSCHGN
jgi:hypothetical protein